MKLKFGAIVTEGVGKLGGHDFMQSRYGPNLRTRSLRTSKVSRTESERKGTLRRVASAWRELTQAQRDQWNNYVKDVGFPSDFYGTVNLSGQMFFCQVNANYYNYNGIAHSVPPPFRVAVQSQLTSVTAYGTGLPLLLYWADWVPTFSVFYVWATRPMSAGVTTQPKHYKFIGTVEVLDSNPYDLQVEYENVFGTQGEPGSRILFRSVVFNVISSYMLVPTVPLSQLPVYWIVDNNNNRILGYDKIPSNNFSTPQYLIGQEKWTDKGYLSAGTPNQFWEVDAVCTVDKKFLVCDRHHLRIMIWNNYPTSFDDPCDLVIGQPSTTGGGLPPTLPPTAATLNYPTDITSDGTRLIVADRNSSRILIYNTVPTVNNVNADLVLGQADFVSYAANRGGACAANTLDNPSSAIISGGKLFVTDSGNNRVLIWNTIPTVNGQAADVVVGQANFTANAANEGGACSATGLNSPYDCSINAGRLYIGDNDNHRVIVHGSIPTTNGASASLCFFQTDFTTNTANRGLPTGDDNGGKFHAPAFKGSKMLVIDKTNRRILVYNSIPTVNVSSADSVIGQPNFAGNAKNAGTSTNRQGLDAPQRNIIPSYLYPYTP